MKAEISSLKSLNITLTTKIISMLNIKNLGFFRSDIMKSKHFKIFKNYFQEEDSTPVEAVEKSKVTNFFRVFKPKTKAGKRFD